VRNLDAYQENYATLPFEASQARYRKRKIVESLAKYRARSILEIGCGFDPIFNHYATFDHCTIVEPGSDFVLHAREQAQSHDGITVVHGTLEDSIDTLLAMRYDFIVLSSLLHEIRDTETLLDATARLCDPTTIVHINVPNARSFHRLLALEMGIIGDLFEKSATQQRMQQSHTFDVDSLATLVSQSGFQVVEQGSFFLKPFTHAQMASLQAAGLITDLMLDGLYNLSKYFPDNGSEIFMNVRLRA
jgi:2-polyprenyl-3-methyl-5-hydroxy-6-metoxy-1,4-benzoquinol methylase